MQFQNLQPQAVDDNRMFLITYMGPTLQRGIENANRKILPPDNHP